ncbi:glutaredoxin family protein [Rathayibacter soli]|uniref:glutaredoxin family protein n=1 Tax=Rathayibacter soli TaxID=3144168 RepID=UPI0027E402D9|nr:glutaredoxin family protein [Glaciibacter superstes]
MTSVQLTLIGKPGCHLCDDARDIVVRVLDEFEPDAVSHRLTELSILDDPALAQRYAEEIPVLLIDGTVHTYWRVDPARLRSALTTALREAR